MFRMLHIFRIHPTFAFLMVCGLLGALCWSAPCAAQRAKTLPVGYDHPESDAGGPTLAGGPHWLQAVWPNRLTLATRVPGGKLRVLAFVNRNGLLALRGLEDRFPLEVVTVIPSGDGCHMYTPGDFADALAYLRSEKPIDVIAMSRVNPGSIPPEVIYEILQRVRERGTGFAFIDNFDQNDYLKPDYLQLKTERSRTLIPGVPYAGFMQWDCSQQTRILALNYWNTSGFIRTAPAATPHQLNEVAMATFGKGKMLWANTNTSWDRYYGARAFAPQMNLRRSMWINNDYYASWAVKAFLLASGRPRAALITNITPAGANPGAAQPTLTCTAPAGQDFSGTLRWQIRNTWGEVLTKGTMPLDIPAAGAAVALEDVTFRHAGPQYLDVWIDNKAGETVDWGSTYVSVAPGAPAPVITLKYPEGTPRGEDLAGTVTLADVPAGATLRLRLIDRYWRQVGTQSKPAVNGETAFAFPSAGLDGQIWWVRAEVQQQGTLIADAATIITSPVPREQRSGFHPLMTGPGGDTPEGSAGREFLRRIGFLSNRMYGPSNGMEAEANLWNDIQPFPFPFNVTGPSNDYTSDRLTDWEDPAVKQDFAQAVAMLTKELKPFGLRGFNLTDDSGAASELTLGAYTTAAFHGWLTREYGDFARVCQEWGWTPVLEPLDGDELPYDPYVTIAFHQWLQKKYGGLTATAKAWGVTPEGFGSLHTWGTIQREMLKKLNNTVANDDVKAFLADYRTTEDAKKRSPFGGIYAATIKQAYDAGHTTAWIDAQRALQQQWVDNMDFIQQEGRKHVPGMLVGTDAAYYASSLSEAFGRLGYVAPYYDDRAVKVAVSRGRMRRDGDFGACLGSYGEKPANLSGRRAQIWDVLFAGGTGLYYWIFGGGTGFKNDLLELSDKHALYQCEVIEEISNGIGDLATGCRRVFDPVALLDSPTSSICDQLEKRGKPITSQGNSIGAFQFAMEDCGLNPDTIIPAELTDGWLGRAKTKVLLLPGVNSMRDDEIEAVKAFVKGGGVVIADVRAGARRPNGNLREANPLDEVFGITFDAQGKTLQERGEMTGKATAGGAELTFGETLADPRITAAGATALGRIKDAQTLFIHKYGAGTAVLFNASFASYSTLRTNADDHWKAWHAVIASAVALSGVRPAFTWTSAGKETSNFELSPFRNGAGYLLGIEDLGGGDFAGKRRPISITLPGTFQVYDVRAGKFIAAGRKLDVELPRNGHRLYSLLPYKVKAVTVKPSATTLNAGDTVTLTIDVQPEGAARRDLHVVRVEAFDPAGASFFPFKRVLPMPAQGARAVPLTTALNDAPGTWTFQVTDVNTGITTSTKITVKGGAR